MPAKRADVEHLLERVLGFDRFERDHHRFRLVIDGKRIAETKTSHGHDTIGDGLLADMARQLRITPSLFRALLAGKKGRADYLEALRQQGLLPPGE